MYVTGVTLTCTGVLTLLLTVGLGIFISRYGRLPCIKRKHLNPGEFQMEQLSEQAVAPTEEEERSSYEQLDMNAIAKPSLYSEFRSRPQGHQKDTVSDNEFESFEGRSESNVYDEPHGAKSGRKALYVNTVIAGYRN
ncbi:uncharacterized protein LOC110453767 [Mizuhopecten yessoensis]|uniref:uncharacterized protein LOC110453767 n=1 Tax=Mizuhopecten yessoensis TaxID=6573 RepID=UPI000B458356|nr:uncharacterized protein LOC110453767 [Mizuhopecten yessoensis]